MDTRVNAREWYLRIRENLIIVIGWILMIFCPIPDGISRYPSRSKDLAHAKSSSTNSLWKDDLSGAGDVRAVVPRGAEKWIHQYI
jgi:hypothetical protein